MLRKTRRKILSARIELAFCSAKQGEDWHCFFYILFDLDGTVSDPKAGITGSVQYALRALGIEEPDLDRLELFIGPPLRDSFQEYYKLNEEQTEFAVKKYRERFCAKGFMKIFCIRG